MSSNEYEDITLVLDDPVALITLNRPNRMNAFRGRTMHELRHAIELASADPRVVGIVITGAGRGFCVGLDAGDLAGAVEAGPQSAGAGTSGDEPPTLFSYILDVPKPVIAAVNGMCAGGGFVLAMLCDLRFASDAAVFNTVFTRRGLISEHGTSWFLPRIVGLSRALDLLWSSRSVPAAEAFSMGLADRLTTPDELVRAATDYVRELARTTSPESLRAIKSMVHDHLHMSWPEAAVEADEAMQAAVAAPDFKEGVASFLEERPPSFARLGEAADGAGRPAPGGTS